MNAISKEDAHHAAQAINAMNARRTARATAGAEIALAIVLGIAGAALLLHYLEPCATGTLCMAAVITPTRSGSRHAVLRWWRGLYLRMRLADVACCLARVEDDLAELPLLRDALAADVDALRRELRQLQGAHP